MRIVPKNRGFLSLLILAATVGLACGGEKDTPSGEDAEEDGEADGDDGDSADSADTAEGADTGNTDTGNDTTADTDTDTGADTDTGNDTTDTGGFVQNDTMVGCGTMCDIWTPGECPEGEKCTSVACEVGSNAWDSNVCRPVMGDNTVGDDCMGAGLDGNDDCAEGLMCWDANPDTGLGTCIAFCVGSVDNPDCEDQSELCAVANEGTLPICLPECDPLSPACPNSSNLCIPNPGEPGFVCVLDASGGMATYGTPCNGPNADDNSCNLGLVCTFAEAVPAPNCTGAPGCCSPICDLSEPNTCPGADQGQMCVAWFDEGNTPPGYEDVGICAVPA